MSWKDYFRFSGKERAALVVLGFVMVTLTVLPGFFPEKPPDIPAPVFPSSGRRVADSPIHSEGPFGRAREIRGNGQGSNPIASLDHARQVAKSLRGTIASFDPNSADTADLLALGFPDRVVLTLLHYRQRGGHFRQPSDLGKIYGLSPACLARLTPLVRINRSRPARAIQQAEGQAVNDGVNPGH